MFGTDSTEAGGYDFTTSDMIMPHPVYAPQFFRCVLHPCVATFKRVRPFLAEADDAAIRKQAKETEHDRNA